MGLFDFKNNKMLKAQRPVVITSLDCLPAVNVTTDILDGTHTANRAILVPFVLVADGIVEKITVANGTVVSGNVDVGIYNEAYTRLVSSGSTAQAGTSALQIFDITDTPLKAGRYYMAFCMDNTTGRAYRGSLGGSVAETLYNSMHLIGDITAFPLPATITPDQNTGSVPLMAVYFRTWAG